jgi:monoamine oxidase
VTGLTRRQALGGLGAAIVAGAAPRAAWGQTEADVVVIGAGLAGLHAARLLEQAGQRVVVVEAQQRIGGRLHTLDHLPGRPEAGGIQVGAAYHRLEAIAAECGIGLLPAPPPPRDRRTRYRIQGANLAAAEWEAAAVNRLRGAERAIPPDGLLRHYLARLPRQENVRSWLLPSAAAEDRALAASLSRGGASPEAVRLIDVNLNAPGVSQVSTLHFLRQAAVFSAGAGPIRTIAGGSQRLPEAMARRLGAPPRLGQVVRAIEQDGGGVTVRFADGGSLRARRCICTIPFAALRGVTLPAGLAPPLRRLVRDLPYVPVIHLHLLARGPAAQAFPEVLWTDDPLLGRVFRAAEAGDAVQLKAWYSGALAARTERTAPDLLRRRAVAALEAAMPALRGQIEVTGLMSWQANPFARGAYHCLGPGLAAALAMAVNTPGDRLSFAGEHLGLTANGMEGALESGAAAAARALA